MLGDKDHLSPDPSNGDLGALKVGALPLLGPLAHCGATEGKKTAPQPTGSRIPESRKALGAKGFENSFQGMPAEPLTSR